MVPYNLLQVNTVCQADMCVINVHVITCGAAVVGKQRRRLCNGWTASVLHHYRGH